MLNCLDVLRVCVRMRLFNKIKTKITKSYQKSVWRAFSNMGNMMMVCK